MQNLVRSFFQLKIKRKQRFQVRQQFQNFEYAMNQTLILLSFQLDQIFLLKNCSSEQKVQRNILHSEVVFENQVSFPTLLNPVYD
jgi:hypothetical protein